MHRREHVCKCLYTTGASLLTARSAARAVARCVNVPLQFSRCGEDLGSGHTGPGSVELRCSQFIRSCEVVCYMCCFHNSLSTMKLLLVDKGLIESMGWFLSKKCATKLTYVHVTFENVYRDYYTPDQGFLKAKIRTAQIPHDGRKLQHYSLSPAHVRGHMPLRVIPSRRGS